MTNKQNLIINGSGSYPGGSYNKVSIRGEGTIVSDMVCSVFSTFGTSEALGNVKVTDTMKVFGETEMQKDFDAGEISIMGTMAIGGKAAIKKLKVFGTLDVEGCLSGEYADIKGTISVNGDVEYDEFKSTGGFEIKGLLNAESIRISLRYNQSHAEEIGGGKIIVKRKYIPFFKESGSLSVKMIEGDDVYLENTEADVVRGKTVRIGPGCTIGLVEYYVDYNQNANSTVKMKTQLV